MVIKLFGKILYIFFVVDKSSDKLLGYSINYTKSKSLTHAKSIIKFHNLHSSNIIEDKTLEDKLKQSIEMSIKGYNKEAIKHLGIDFEEVSYRNKDIYEYLLSIKAGEVSTYSKIKEYTKKPIPEIIKTLANNPLLILIPCHRIIRKDGKISGYTPLGKEFKIKLLEKEGYLKQLDK